jgi:hypothetical protein
MFSGYCLEIIILAQNIKTHSARNYPKLEYALEVIKVDFLETV